MPDDNDIKDSSEQFERARRDGPRYKLRLYVAGSSALSSRALRNIKQICSGLAGHYELHVVDVHQSPALAREAQIVAVPTLVRESPPPVRKLVGDLSDRNRVRRFLDLPAEAGEATA